MRVEKILRVRRRKVGFKKEEKKEKKGIYNLDVITSHS